MKLLGVCVILLVSAAVVAGEEPKQEEDEIPKLEPKEVADIQCSEAFNITSEDKRNLARDRSGEPNITFPQRMKCYFACTFKKLGMVSGHYYVPPEIENEGNNTVNYVFPDLAGFEINGENKPVEDKMVEHGFYLKEIEEVANKERKCIEKILGEEECELGYGVYRCLFSPIDAKLNF